MTQRPNDPLRDSHHIVLAHSARGAGWRAKAQPISTQGRARIAREDLPVRRNADAIKDAPRVHDGSAQSAKQTLRP